MMGVKLQSWAILQVRMRGLQLSGKIPAELGGLARLRGLASARAGFRSLRGSRPPAGPHSFGHRCLALFQVGPAQFPGPLFPQPPGQPPAELLPGPDSRHVGVPDQRSGMEGHPPGLAVPAAVADYHRRCSPIAFRSHPLGYLHLLQPGVLRLGDGLQVVPGQVLLGAVPAPSALRAPVPEMLPAQLLPAVGALTFQAEFAVEYGPALVK